MKTKPGSSSIIAGTQPERQMSELDELRAENERLRAHVASGKRAFKIGVSQNGHAKLSGDGFRTRFGGLTLFKLELQGILEHADECWALLRSGKLSERADT